MVEPARERGVCFLGRLGELFQFRGGAEALRPPVTRCSRAVVVVPQLRAFVHSQGLDLGAQVGLLEKM